MSGRGARSRFVVAAALAVVIYGLILLFTRFRAPVGFAFYGLVWLFGVNLALGAIFSRLDTLLVARWPDPEDARWRIGAYTALGLVLGVVIFDLLYLLLRLYEWKVVGSDNELSIGHLLSASGLAALLATIVGATVLASGDLGRWRGAALAVRALEEERTALQLAALRRQLNPHFLFNSLNTLASLIPESPAAAATFVEELAEVYRHVLKSDDQEVVALGEELQAAEALAFVLSRRFEDAFRLELAVGGAAERYSVVPLTLLTLLENTIKHNVVTREQPLTVRVRSTGNTLEVAHRHQPKACDERQGVGLANLRRSYEMLCGRTVEVEAEGERFTVRVPLVEVERYADRHRRG